MKPKTLPRYISDMGDRQFAQMMGIGRRTACKWRLRESHPHVLQAWKIVKQTRGEVDYEGVYGRHPAIYHNYKDR